MIANNELWVRTYDGSVAEMHTDTGFTQTLVSTVLNDDGWTVFAYASDLTAVGDMAFYAKKNITDVMMPDTVKKVGSSAFTFCTKLASVDCGTGCTSLGTVCFSGCTSLSSMSWNNNLTSYGRECFSNCSALTSIDLSSKIYTIGQSVFYRCGFTSIDLKNVTTIELGAFAKTKITSLTSTQKLKTIGQSAFASCTNLKTVVLGDNVKEIKYSAFSNCSAMTSVTLGNGLTTISGSLFSGCTSLEYINVPDSVTAIGADAFSNCTKLKYLDIGSGVAEIGTGIVAFCKSLQTIRMRGSQAPIIQMRTFSSLSGLNGKLYVPCDSNYTDWMSTENYYLGKYGWTRVFYDKILLAPMEAGVLEYSIKDVERYTGDPECSDASVTVTLTGTILRIEMPEVDEATKFTITIPTNYGYVSYEVHRRDFVFDANGVCFLGNWWNAGWGVGYVVRGAENDDLKYNVSSWGTDEYRNVQVGYYTAHEDGSRTMFCVNEFDGVVSDEDYMTIKRNDASSGLRYYKYLLYNNKSYGVSNIVGTYTDSTSTPHRIINASSHGNEDVFISCELKYTNDTASTTSILSDSYYNAYYENVNASYSSAIEIADMPDKAGSAKVKVYGGRLMENELVDIKYRSSTGYYQNIYPLEVRTGADIIVYGSEYKRNMHNHNYTGKIKLGRTASFDIKYEFPADSTNYGMQLWSSFIKLSTWAYGENQFKNYPKLDDYSSDGFADTMRGYWSWDSTPKSALMEGETVRLCAYLNSGTYVNANVEEEGFDRTDIVSVFMDLEVESEIVTDIPTTVDEEVDVEFNVTCPSGRQITIEAPDEFMFDVLDEIDNGDGTTTYVYNMLIDEVYPRAMAEIRISDGYTIIAKTIRVTSNDSEMDKPIITFNETDIQIPQSGSTVEVTVYYDNVRSVNDPMSTVFGVSLTVVSEVDTETGKEIKYLISVPYTEMGRSFAVIFSAIGVEGSSCTATLPIIQLGSASSVTLEPVIGVYPASGEYRTNAIKAVFQNTNGAHVTDVRVYSYTSKGMVLDITNKSEAWIKCYLNTAGGDDTRYEYYDVKVKSWEGTEPHYGEIVLTYKDTNGQTHLATYTVVQEAMDAGVDELDPEIQPYVTNLRVTAKGTNAQQSNMNYINVMYQDFRTGLVFNPISGAMWFKIVRQEEVERTENDVLIRYYWTADENTDTKARTTSVLFSGTAEGKALRTSVSVIQAKAGKEEEERPTDIPVIEGTYIGPIWKDVEFDFGNVEKVGYTIYYGDELIFKGKSWRRPNMTNNKIMVNKICQNYLVQTYLDLEKVSWEINNKDFTLRSEDGSIICHTYRFVNDWSYSDDFRAGLLSRPILNNQRAVRGQMFPFSVLGAGKQVSVEYGIDYIDGYTDEFGIPIQDWWNTEYVTNGVSTEFFSTARKNADYINKVWIGESEYSLEDKCFIPYVIYYNNPWGGFDWFPIGGKVTVKDKVTPYTYTKNYNNTTLEFGRCRYLSEIDRTYTVNTGWLKQEESDRMWYLLQSNIVYLHDIKADKIYPVTISDTEIEHKQKTRTEKIINYTFNLQLSHTRERL